MDRGLKTGEPASHRAEPGAVAQFLHTAAYAGAEAPIRALAQIADHLAGTHWDAGVESGFKAIGIKAPEAHKFGSKGWYAQQLGTAVGMALPFLGLRTGMRSLVAGADAGATLTQAAGREALLSGSTGLVFGAVLSPSDAKSVGKTGFFADRLESGLTDAGAFAAMGFAGTYAGAGMEAAAGTVERSALPAAAKTPLAAALRFPLVSGAMAGIPAGVINAETNAWKNGKVLAGTEDLKENVVGMAFVGGVLGAGSRLLERPKTDTVEAVTPQQPAKGADSAPQSEAELRAAVEKALKQIQLNRQVREAGGPQARLLDTLAKATTRRYGLVAPGDSEHGTPTYVPSKPAVPGMEVVLGASGIEAPAHAGFLQALVEKEVPIGRITCVSGGSIPGTLFANGYSPKHIESIMLSDEFRYPKLSVLAECLHTMDPWNLYPYSFDFRPWVRDFIKTYNLKAQPNLRYVAADAETHEPVVFEGPNMDLETAITAASAATPGMNMKPVMINGRETIDGFYFHPTPASLCVPPAIASKIGFVHELPSELLSPWDYMMHLREMSYYDEFKRRYPDPPGHIIVTTGLPDVATTTFGVSGSTLAKLVKHGHDATIERLKQPDAQKAIAAARKS